MITTRKIETKDDFKAFTQGENIRVALFHASWCGPCRVLESTIKNLDKEQIGDTLFGEFDVDNENFEDTLVEYSIRNVPVMLFFKNGLEAKKLVGNVPATEIYNVIKELSNNAVDNNIN
jgi:thioredoxin 1